MEEVKITGVVPATRPPMIKLDKLEEKRKLDIRILEYKDENFLYLSQGPEVCIFMYMLFHHSRWGCLMAVFNVIFVMPLWGLNERIVFLPTARILIVGV